MSDPRRIGLFGGTFDPPHEAHVALARLALTELSLDELRWIPAGEPWQKARDITPAAQREAMVRGRRSGDLTPSEAWDIATTSSDDDEADRRALARLEGAQPGAGELNLAQLEHRQREQLLAERAGRRERLIQLNRQREQDEPA